MGKYALNTIMIERKEKWYSTIVVIRRTDYIMDKRKGMKRQTMVDYILHRKLTIE